MSRSMERFDYDYETLHWKQLMRARWDMFKFMVKSLLIGVAVLYVIAHLI